MRARDHGLRWLAWLIAGPTVWAATFSAAYGLNGLGCALGWSARIHGPLDVQRVVVLAVWLVGLTACIILIRRVKLSLGPDATIPRTGLWIGFGATLFTLAPAIVATPC